MDRPAVQTASATHATATPRAASPWILDEWRDLLLFIGTPLLILVAFALVQPWVRIADIALYVAAFGALGHHLPGMMRAYGDRELFQRFRVRFIAAPVFLGVACAAGAKYELSALTLVAVLWGTWHGLMQTYGFVRIYDAKAGSFDRVTRQLDLAMCIAWFGAGMLLSPNRLFTLLEMYYVRCAAPLPAWLSVPLLQRVWAWGTGVVTVLFLINLLWCWWQSRPPSTIKLLLMAMSFGFWWYTRVTVTNPLVGVALFEVFHDVQYLSIVWIFNRSRAAKDAGAGAFTRFLFRNSGGLIGVYVGMVFAYGSLGLVAKGFSLETVNHAFQGLLVGSGLLHFYYDGFIWKLREKQTGGALGINNQQDAGGTAGRGFRMPAWMPHGLKWVAFLTPASLLVMSQFAMPVDRPARLRTLAAALPGSSAAQFKLGESLAAKGDIVEAAACFDRALDLDPEDLQARNNLGIARAELGDLTGAAEHFRAVLRKDPRHTDALANYGRLLVSTGDVQEGIDHLRRALELKPDHAAARETLTAVELALHAPSPLDLNDRGILLAQQGKLDEAIALFRQAVQADPTLVASHYNLAVALSEAGRHGEAVSAVDEAVRLEPQQAAIHLARARILVSLGKMDEAGAAYARVLELEPNHAEARVEQARLRVATSSTP